MASQNEALKFRELTPEESDIIATLYDVSSKSFVRVGPKGYNFVKDYEKYADGIYNMQLRNGDVFVATYQRSGTTWVQELVWLVANNLDYKTAAEVSLVQRYKFLEFTFVFSEEMLNDHLKKIADPEKIRQLRELLVVPVTKTLATLPSPRFVKTHLPMSLLPPKILDTAKVVYVARDPRDVIVSCYHHAKLFTMYKFKATFKQLWDAFRKDLYTVTPYFEHVKEAWELRHHPNMLFLFYEDLSKDLPQSIRRVTEFLGKELNQDQINKLCDHLSLDNFKNNKSVNLDDLRELGYMDPKENFIRKGKSGGWRQYFDVEMQREAEQWIAHNLRDTDLRFPTMQS